jgi:STE24 endopeptidase
MPTTEIIAGAFLAMLLLNWAIETGLAGLNLVHALASPDEPPAPLAGLVGPETVRRSRDYTVVRLRLGLVQDAVGAAALLVLLFSGLLPWLETTLVGFGLAGPHLFVIYLVSLLLLSGLMGLPFTLYRTFGIETAFGFNRASLGLWLRDRAKGLALGGAAGPALPLWRVFLYGGQRRMVVAVAVCFHHNGAVGAGLALSLLYCPPI